MRLSLCLAYASVLSFSVSSCAVNPATGGRYLNLAGDTTSLGEQTAQAAIKQEGLYTKDEELTHYYQNLGANLRRVVDAPEEPIDFILLDSPTYNAWATPGYVNMYRGILPYFNSEAEMVSVMAHEAGHVMARHIARSQTKGVLAQVAVGVAAVAIGSRLDSSAAAQATMVLGGLGATVALSSYSRAYEREADELALRYMEKMGYDPREAYHTFRSMKQHRTYAEAVYKVFNKGDALPQSPFYDLLTSHPEPAERMQNVVEAKGTPDGSVRLPAGVEPATEPNDPQGRIRYLKVLDGLPVGPKMAEHGVAGADVFYSPTLRIAWPFAVGDTQGFAMNFVGNVWEGIIPNTNTRLFVRHVQLGEKEDAISPEKLLHKMAGDVSLQKVEKLSAAGRTGVIGFHDDVKDIFGNAYADGKIRVAVLPIAGEQLSKSFLMAYFLNWEDTDVRTSLDKMKHLSKAQADRIEPLRLRVRSVKAGDTLATLSRRMETGGSSALRQAYFMALNGLTGDSPLIPSAKVKVVENSNRGRF